MLAKISIESSYLIPNNNSDIKDFIRSIPNTPGVYKFLDKSKTPLYIGKAKNLDKRLASYFRSAQEQLMPRYDVEKDFTRFDYDLSTEFYFD